MLSQEKLLVLIGEIYDAASDERLWPVFLEHFADAVNGTFTSIIHHDLGSRRAQLMITARPDSEALRRYKEYYCTFDPYRAASLARYRQPGPDAVYIAEELIDPRQLHQTEFYNDFSLRHDLVHHFGCRIAMGANWVSNISSHRPRDREPFGHVEVSLLQLLWPHLQRAIQFHRKFAELQSQHLASLEALDHLTVGVVLLDQACRIVAMNREAQRVLDQKDGLAAGKDGLTAARPHENRELRVVIAGATKTGSAGGLGDGGILGIPRPSGKRSFVLLVAPVGRQAFALGIKAPSVIVFVTDPERKPEEISTALARIYELTNAESRVATLLMQGETLTHAAEHLGISHNTARTHLQRIYEKTGTSHQGDLIRVLLTARIHA
jgi:DNA-binding CsgD family transcriptional regulator/PAS domain-containing protein